MEDATRQEVFDKLKELLTEYVPPLKAGTDKPGNFEVTGRKETMQGRKKVDGYFFASVVKQKNHVGFYFFPIYTDPEAFQQIPEVLQKALKGKSCFHVKKNDDEIFNHIRKMVGKGLEVYSDRI